MRVSAGSVRTAFLLCTALSTAGAQFSLDLSKNGQNLVSASSSSPPKKDQPINKAEKLTVNCGANLNCSTDIAASIGKDDKTLAALTPDSPTQGSVVFVIDPS